MRDIDGQDELKTLWGLDDRKFLIRKDTEDWIKKRQSAGMVMLKHLKEQDFAR